MREKSKVKNGAAKETKDEYIEPAIASMEEFTLKTAVGVSPALKKKTGYIISTLF